MRFTVSFSLFFLLLTAHPAFVFAWPTEGVNGRLNIAASRFIYEEFDAQGKKLLTEKGWLPGIQAGIGLYKSKWYLDGEIAYFNGKVDYTGRTNLGTSLGTKTDEEILKVSLTGGRWILQNEGWRLGLFGGGGHRWWWRDIRAAGQVNGLSEKYTTWFWFIGSRLEHIFSDRITASLEGKLIRPIDPEVEVRFTNKDDANLRSEEKFGYSISAVLNWYWTKSMQVALRPSFTQWKFGKSATQALTWHSVPVGTVYEPDSETRISTVELMIVYSF